MTPDRVSQRLLGFGPRARLGFAALLGALAALGQAPFDLAFLALAAWAGLFALLATAPTARRGAALAWAFGAGHFALALHWIVEPFFVDAARHGWMAPFALVFLAGGLALFWGGAGWVALRLAGDRPIPRAIAAAGALALAEWLRGWVFTGFPWAAPAQIWADGPARAIFAWTGSEGFTLLTLLAAALTGACLARRPALAVPAGAALVLPALGIGSLLMPPPVTLPPGQPVIRLVQPNAPQHEKWDRDHVLTFYQRQLSFTAAPGRPDLVVWPETAIPWSLDRADEALRQITTASNGIPVALGLQRRGEDGGWHNSMIVTDGAGRADAVYDKHHLVPFGEYMPLSGLAQAAGIAGLAANSLAGFAPGPGPVTLDLGRAGRALPLICYELIFPRNIRGAAERPDFLLHITNDAWFGETAGPQQHFAQARIRAAEFGLPVLRAANTGISALIDPAGRVLVSLPLGEEGYIDVALPAPYAPTLYARSGPLPWVAAALFLLLLAGRPRRKPD
ncbi:apolipoprotein N-acyltransferase [Ovoidimarina sediminis]|uniref:apolipoprotein N-acyltransferase n=1 Tax=Ovoidimarina sediminis TaxID=3079856 RepID=UPI0029065792|nr:apolipoprotein N-acyltransferase [Rhodophyticola sp. MJ-SS7]MDU8942840.1 apolipoprotein N-acyltransferase [Rhodophyticola sp. MJ-SS7]